MINKISLLFVIFGVLFLFTSCDDAGIAKFQNNGTFTHSNLQRIDPNVDGVYELWVSFNSTTDHDESEYISMGRFNINASGNVVDTSGNPKTFNFKRTPPSITTAGDALITIQQPGNNDTIPSGTRILGGSASVGTDFVTFNMTMTYNEVLGSIAAQFSNDSCKYILNTPSTPDTNDYYRGLWLTTDIAGTNTGLTCQTLADTIGWDYQGWIYLLSNPIERYSIGKFNNPSSSSNGPTCGTTGTINKPGAEMLDSICTNNSVLNLNNGLWGFMITLEPKNEVGSATTTPFFIKLFGGGLGVAGYRSIGSIIRTVSLPTGILSISRQ